MTTDLTTDLTTDMTTDMTTDLTTDMTTDLTTDMTTDMTTDLTTDHRPATDMSTDMTTDKTTDLTTEQDACVWSVETYSLYALTETTDTVVPECPVIPLGERVDCFPDAGASKLGCLQRGCCWSPLDERNAPWCFFSTNHGYSVVREEKPNTYSLSALLKRKVAPSLFGEDIEELAFHVDMQTVNRLRFKISDAHTAI
nr:sucrase-isomaltase, intestinal-like [Salvelinus alpinus]